MKHIAITCIAIVFAGLFTSCSTAPKAGGNFEVIIEMDESRKNRLGSYLPLEVHLIALNRENAYAFQEYPMSEYWNPKQAGRYVYEKQALSFGEDQPPSKTLSRNSPAWASWSKTQEQAQQKDMFLFVLADLRGSNFPDESGTSDARRLIIPLDPKRWKSTRTIRVSIKRDGIVCLTPFDKSPNK